MRVYVPPNSVLSSIVCAQDFRTPLMEAAIDDNDELVERLVHAGADVNAVDLVSKQCAGACWVGMAVYPVGHAVVSTEVKKFQILVLSKWRCCPCILL